MRRIFTGIFKLSGWRVTAPLPPEIKKCVVVGAPHTSNWDFILCIAAFDILKRPLKFTIKQEWLKFPYNLLMRPLGAIPINRNLKQSTVAAMAALFDLYNELAIVVTPEGTRSKREQWRTGFYYTALRAGVPIVLGFADYRTKTAGAGEVIYPSGNLEKDMEKIMDFYKNIHPKHPEKFSLDLRYTTS